MMTLPGINNLDTYRYIRQFMFGYFDTPPAGPYGYTDAGREVCGPTGRDVSTAHCLQALTGKNFKEKMSTKLANKL